MIFNFGVSCRIFYFAKTYWNSFLMRVLVEEGNFSMIGCRLFGFIISFNLMNGSGIDVKYFYFKSNIHLLILKTDVCSMYFYKIPVYISFFMILISK